MKNKIVIFTPLIIAGLAVCLSACKVSKDIRVPDTALPVSYRDESADTLSVGKLPWSSFFEDPGLRTLIADALVHNYDLQFALKNIDIAELAFKQARLGNIPSAGLSATATSNRPSDNSLNGLSLGQFLGTKHIEDYTVAATLSWEADIWGKIRSQKASALAGYLSSREARQAVQTKIVSDLAKSYYELLMLDTQLAIARHNLMLNDSTLNLVQLQYNSGQVTSLAVQQALAQKLTSAKLVPQFEQQIILQENAISVLSGHLPDKIGRASGLDAVNIGEKNGTGMPADLLSLRPDVRQAELEVSRANAGVGFAKANMYPSFTISAQGGIDAIKASNWFNIPASLFGAVAGGLTQPLFNQKKLSTAYRISLAEREKSVIRFRQTVLIAVGEVSDAIVEIDKLKQQQTLIAERTMTLQLATHNAQLLFNNGLATYLEVITAQGNVLQSELELAAVKKARLDAGVELYRSLGGGND